MLVLSKLNLSIAGQWLENARTEGASALIDKEPEWTSFDVVAKLRNLTQIKKVGHAGTLDPLASGLLILCFGKATKNIQAIQDASKRYSGIIKLGFTTLTDDSEGEEQNPKLTDNLTGNLIETEIKTFLGKISQIPPQFSARKVNGVRAYKMARKNKEVEFKPAEVEIFKFEVLKIELPFVHFNIHCSKGTYIRSIARDLGEKLGCGGYLSELRRTNIGDYSVDNALKVNDFSEVIKQINI